MKTTIWFKSGMSLLQRKYVYSRPGSLRVACSPRAGGDRYGLAKPVPRRHWLSTLAPEGGGFLVALNLFALDLVAIKPAFL